MIKTSKLPTVLPAGFAELCTLHWPRPIRDNVDYRNAREIVERLSLQKRRTRDQEDYLEAISLFMEKFDENLFPASERAGAVEVLRHLMEARGMSASDLGRLLGSRTLGPAIVRGGRKISRRNAAKLAEHFKVSSAIFFQP
jgi:antitoxin component HigA of HigAB toxin-antitoxin module